MMRKKNNNNKNAGCYANLQNTKFLFDGRLTTPRKLFEKVLFYYCYCPKFQTTDRITRSFKMDLLELIQPELLYFSHVDILFPFFSFFLHNEGNFKERP